MISVRIQFYDRTRFKMVDSFYFLRHGQTDWNDQGLLMGQHDISLNELGRQQAKEAGKIMSGHAIASLCYSPLARTKETAQIIAELCPCSLYEMENLMERRWGVWEGLVLRPEQLHEAEDRLPRGAETKMEFQTRVLKGFEQAHLHPSPILFVSHGGVFHILCSKFNIECESLPNANVAHFFQQLGKWHVEILAL